MSSWSKEFDVLVVGGGPAGLAAAACAAESGQRVGLVDDNPAAGGQIWRGEKATTAPAASAWAQRLKVAGGELLCGARVVHQPRPGVLSAETLREEWDLTFQKLVIATGARERFLPFPGWTLPNVMGAGGLQAMVKSGLSVAGKRVVVAGSGPLLLAVAAYLKSHGANVLLICEQASLSSLARFGTALLLQPKKLAEGWSLWEQLSGIPYSAASWPVRAEGHEKLESATVSRSGKLTTLFCDYLACGFHLVPNVELAALLGCRLKDGFVEVGDSQETSVQNVFCAGEPTGIGGLELSLIEGQIAGYAAANRSQQARKYLNSRHKLQKFSRAMDRCFALRNALKALPYPDTILCRCEDVTVSRVRAHTSWRSAKLQTRCGMGPCQGRVCGPAAQFLFNWKPDSVRPPIFPARFSSIADFAFKTDQNSESVIG